MEDGRPIAVLRLSGELSTKARATRRRFLGQLVANLREALANEGLEASVERAHERVYLLPADARAVEIASRIFGVSSISLAERAEFACLDDLVAQGDARFADAVRGGTSPCARGSVGGRETATSARATSSVAARRGAAARRAAASTSSTPR